MGSSRHLHGRQGGRGVPHLLALEPRMMFDAAAVVTAEAVTVQRDVHADAAPAHDAALSAFAHETRTPAPVAAEHDRSPDHHAVTVGDGAGTGVVAGQNQIIFIDTSVDDYRQLAAEWAGKGEVVLVDGTRDGLVQVQAALAGRSGIDAIHIVSHGEKGVLFLGTTRIDDAAITGGLAPSLAAIGGSLNPDGDLLLYGCDFAAGDAGARTLADLAAVTGADVAASTDTTGYAGRGGDWALEAHHGDIGTRALVAADWVHTLDPNTPVPIAVTADTLTVIDATGMVVVSGTVGYGADDRSPDVGEGAVAIWADAAIYRGHSVDLKATVVSLSTGDAIRFNRPGQGAAADDPTFLLRDLTAANDATVSIRWELVDHFTGAALPADVRFTIADIDGIGGAPGTRESVTASTDNLAYFTRERTTDINFTASLSAVTASGTQDENTDSTKPITTASAATFDWSDVSAFTLTYKLTTNTVTNQAQFYQDGDADFVYTDPVYVSIPRLDLDANNSTAPGNDAHFTFTENGAAVPVVDSDVVVSNPMDIDSVQSATVVLTNAKAGDQLVVGTLPTGVTAVTSSSGGAITVTLNGLGSETAFDAALRAITFNNTSDTPDPTQRVIAVTFSNDTLTSATATSRIDVVPVNDAPVSAGRLPAQATADRATVSYATAGGFADADGDALRYAATGLPTGLTIDAVTGVISGTLDRSASQPNGGAYDVVVTATDPAGAAATQRFGISVANPAPTAADDRAATHVATPVTIAPLSNDADPDGDPIAVTGVTAAGHGRTTINPDGTITYTPDAGFAGTDTFQYRIADGEGGTAMAAVTIAVTDTAPAATPFASQAVADGQSVRLDAGAHFTDADADPLTFGATGLPPGLFIDRATGIISGTVDRSASLAGSYDTIVTADDGHGGSTAVPIRWIVSNPAPIAADDRATTAEDTAIVVDVLANDRDPDGDPLTVTRASADHGRMTIQRDGTIAYRPDADFNGTDTVRYTVGDGQGGTADATVTITVTPVNDAPTSTGIAPRHDMAGSTVSLPVAAAFADVDADVLTFAATGLPAGLSIDPVTGVIHGTLAAGSTHGAPAGDGRYAVTVVATDPSGASSSTGFVWTIDPVAPVARDDAATTPQETPVTIAVLANDGSVDGDALTVVSAASPDGTVAVNPDGTLTFTPAAGRVGAASIAYTVTDRSGRQASAIVAVTITPVNHAPTAAAIPGAAASEGQAVTLDVGGFFADRDGDRLAFSATGLPRGLAIDPATGRIGGTIDSAAGRDGPYHVTVTATDPGGATVSSSFDWAIANPSPVANDDRATVRENMSTLVPALDNDRDPDGDPLTVTAASASHGSVTIAIDGSLFYTPASGFSGTDVISYTISDGQGGTATAGVVVTVLHENRAPVAAVVPARQDAFEGRAISIDAGDWFRDPDGDALTFSATGLPDGLTIDPATGVIAGVPGRGGAGLYPVTITATDVAGASAVVRLPIGVVDPRPVVADDVARTSEGTGIVIPVLANDRDPAGSPLTITGASAVNGTVAIAGDGTLRYTPGNGFAGTDTVRYTVADGEGGTATATVLVTVDPVNHAPVIPTRGVVDAVGGRPVRIDALAGASDPDRDPITVTGASAANGTVVVQPDGTLVFTPALGFAGTTTVSYTVSDGRGGAATGTLVVRVADGRAADIEELLAIGRARLHDPAPGLAVVHVADGVIRTPLVLLDTVGQVRSLRSIGIGDRAVGDAVEAIGTLRGTAIDRRAPIGEEVRRLDHLRDLRDAGDRLFDPRWGDFLVHGRTGFSAAADGHAGIMIESTIQGGAIYIEVRDTAAADARMRTVDVRLADGGRSDWIKVDPRGLAIIEPGAGADELHLIVRVTRENGHVTDTPIVIQRATGEIELDRHAGRPAHHPSHRAVARPLDATLSTPHAAHRAQAQRLTDLFK